MKLSVAYSPCPNDTFAFCGLAEGRVELPAAAFGGTLEVDVRLHDVETLNRMAFDRIYDVTKLSFHAWLHVRADYRLLRVGAALGRGCGPLVVVRAPPARSRPTFGRIAVPGEHTTAHLLLRLWAPEARDRVFVPYDRIMEMVANGDVDAGVIIHEGRFVYRQRGLACLVDLGDWWESQTGLPIPLGCLAARESLGAGRIAACEEMIERSLRFALSNPAAPLPYVRRHAQELDDDVIRQHIQLYVNEFTLDLGETGRAAVAALEALARRAGIGP